MNLEAIGRSWRAWVVDDERDRGPWWAPYVWTFVFCVAVAVGVTILSFAFSSTRQGGEALVSKLWRWYQTNLLISLCIGYSIHFMFMAATAVVGRPRLRRFQPRQRSVFYAVVSIIGLSIGWPIGVLLVLGIDVGTWLSRLPRGAFVASAVLALLITVVVHLFFSMKTRQILAEKRATEAQLRLLQAQIEPHFLFNTLANVVSLIEADSARAKAMLESFVDYLRASVSGLGADTHTLGDELALIDAYLRIIQTRLEDRLAFTIDVPDELRAVRVPPLSVQPLVENAIVHGVEPSIAGGRVRIVARRDGATLVVSVGDDGVGLRAGAAAPGPGTPGARTALANIRERLRQAYADDASLSLRPASPRGTEARLVLPLAA